MATFVRVREDFWSTFVLAVMSIMVVFCVGGVLLGLLFSPAARIAAGVWAVLIAAGMMIAWVVNR